MIVLFFYIRNSFSIVESYLVAIFRKYSSVHFYYLSSIIRNREYSIISFAFHRDSVWFEPFSTFSRGELAECLPYKIRSTSILWEEYFSVFDACRHIASSTTWNDDLFAWACILLKYLDMIVQSLTILEYDCCRHESCSSSSDDGDDFHRGSIENSLKKSNQKILPNTRKDFYLFLWQPHLESNQDKRLWRPLH